MEILTCNQCGALVEGAGIRHRRRLFCGDECCEEFEDRIVDHVEPDAVELEKADVLADDGLFEAEYLEDRNDDNDDDDDEF